MAENESLDLSNPYGRRWAILADLIRNGRSFDEVSQGVRKALYKGLRNALKQFAEHGITLEMLIENRHSPQLLQQLVRKAAGHDYLQLFSDVAIVSTQLETQGLMEAFLTGIWETVEDGMTYRIVGGAGQASFADVRDYLDQVREQVMPDVEYIARRLTENSAWTPRMPSGTNGQKIDTTVEMLSMSLLGSPT
ncbi:MAG: hypothetical protein JW818_06355 [Pirellulales bacterium]|nr:hypothetical protein [Pirellulales bacterium]